MRTKNIVSRKKQGKKGKTSRRVFTTGKAKFSDLVLDLKMRVGEVAWYLWEEHRCYLIEDPERGVRATPDAAEAEEARQRGMLVAPRRTAKA